MRGQQDIKTYFLHVRIFVQAYLFVYFYLRMHITYYKYLFHSYAYWVIKVQVQLSV